MSAILPPRWVSLGSRTHYLINSDAVSAPTAARTVILVDGVLNSLTTKDTKSHKGRNSRGYLCAPLCPWWLIRTPPFVHCGSRNAPLTRMMSHSLRYIETDPIERQIA